MQENKTRTFTIPCEDLLHVLVTEPISQDDFKTPITITVSATPISNSDSIKHASEVLSCIYYVIPNYKKSAARGTVSASTPLAHSSSSSSSSSSTSSSSSSSLANKYFLTTLQECTDNNDLKEFGKKMCLLNYQLYGLKNPVYVIVSSTLEITSSLDMMMMLNAYKQNRQDLQQ